MESRKMRKMMMIGAALAALMGPAKADVYACRHLMGLLDMHAAAGKQADQAFQDFDARYGTDTIANDPQLMASAQRIIGEAKTEAQAFADAAEAALSNGCVSPAAEPKFRRWIAQARAVASELNPAN
jgi:hypothetical protein